MRKEPKLSVKKEPMKQAEELLKRQKAEQETDPFLNFFNLSSDIMVIAEPDGAFKKINPATLALLGYTEAELISKPYIDFIHPDDKQASLDEMAKHIKTGASLNFENRYLCKDGSYIWLSWIADYNKKDGITYATARDITQRRQAEAALQQSKNYLDNIINNIGDPVFVKDEQSRILKVNEAFCKMFGLNKADIIGKTLAEDVTPAEQESFLSIDKQVLSDGLENINEETLTLRGGTKHIISTRKTRYIDDTGQKFLVGVIHDISERKHAMDKMSESRLEYIHLFNSVTEAIYLQNKEGVFIDVNEGAVNMYGYSREELIGNTPKIVTAPGMNDIPHIFRLIKKVLETGMPEAFEFWGRRKNGEVFPKDVIIQKIKHFGKDIIISTARDITERKKIEIALAESEKRFRVMADKLPILIWIAGIDKLCNYFNKVWLDFTGRTMEQEIGNGWAEGVHPDDFQNCLDIYSSSFDAQKVFEIEYRLRRHDGEYRWIFDRGTPNYNEKGKFIGYIGSCIDFTGRKQKENELAIANAFNKTLLSSMPFPIVIVDEDGNILYADPNMEKMFGKQTLGKKCWEVYRNDKEQCKNCPLQDEFEIGKTSTMESNDIANGRSFEITHTGIIYNGKKAMLETFHDITDRKIIADTQQFLLECGSPASGQDYFQSMAKYMAEKMKVQYVCIDQLEGNNLVAETLAIYNEGIIENNVRYTLKDTPCGQVLNKGYCYYKKGVSKLFPADDALQDLKAESYIGSTLSNSKGKPIGLIALIGQQELSNEKEIKLLMELISPNVAAELERRHADEILQQRDELITKLTNQVPGVVYQYRLNADGSSCFPFASEGMFDIYEVTPEEVREDATPVLDRLHPDDYNDVVAGIQESARTIELYHSEFRVILPDQGVRWRSNNAKPEQLEDGSILWHGIITDITERKKVEKDLQDHEETIRKQFLTLKGINESIESPIFSLDTKYRYTSFNKVHAATMRSLYAVNIELGENMLNYMTLIEDREIAKQNLDKALQGEYILEEAYSGDDHLSKLYFKISHNPIKDNEGKVVGLAVLATDLTARKKAENEIILLNEQLENRVKERTAALDKNNIELKESKIALVNYLKDLKEKSTVLEQTGRQLKESNAELESFSYSVSHDLRAPLRAINGFSKILAEDYEIKLDSEGKKLLALIGSNTQKMSRLIDDLLSFSRIGKKEVNAGLVNMSSLFQSVIKEQEPITNLKNIAFIINKIPAANADINMVEIVITNLISNAIKFSGKEDKMVIEIQGEEKGDEIVYSIKDNGVGFSMKYADKLFGVFQRLHSEAEFEGTGVGLALVKRIIHKHGGKVWAQSEPGKGATFYFSLPKI